MILYTRYSMTGGWEDQDWLQIPDVSTNHKWEIAPAYNPDTGGIQVYYENPVDNPPMIHVSKAGRAVPVKFSLDGYYDMDILEAGYPKSQETYLTKKAPKRILIYGRRRKRGPAPAVS